MPTWRDDKILELANQLTYSPADKRREQLHAAIALLPAIDPSRAYPWDFVHFRITSFQPHRHIEHVVPGKVLRADLASLIEFLSDTLSIRVEEAAETGEAVLEFEEVSRRFNVSSKTIQRWRKQGLIALRYLYPDGRRRLGFLESSVQQFAKANKERVEKSAAFTQLSEEERRTIVELARQLWAQGKCGIKEISQRIGEKLGRAPETIRYTLRKHDQEHPEAAVFPEDEDGGPQAALTAAQNQPAATPAPAAVSPGEIAFIANPLFEHPDADNIILKDLPAVALARAQSTVSAGINAKAADVYMARMPRDLPAFLQDIFRLPVMPQEIETDAFRRMNYLKFKAARLRDEAGIDATAEKEPEMNSCMAQAGEIKNQILQSNLRIAVHVARKHQRIDRPLIELVSDATIWLMRAIDLFDFSRPVRFSTYAGYAIMKNFARDRAEQLTRRDARVLTGQEEILNAIGAREGQHVSEQIDADAAQNDLWLVIEQLPERDRELLTRHYGLDQSKPALSLAQIGDQMGITKARVRQLETRALRRLRMLLEARQDKLQRASARPK